jgi:orotate phosphoribosyltransferase
VTDKDGSLLFYIIRNKCLIQNSTKLSSGKISNFYFDLKPAMLDPIGSHLITQRFFANVLLFKADFVCGMEMGAVPLIGSICSLSRHSSNAVRGLFVRKQIKEHGTQKFIEGLIKDESLAGKKVIVVEDVVTSGISALTAVKACRYYGAEVNYVISIVDREEGAKNMLYANDVVLHSFFKASEFLK